MTELLRTLRNAADNIAPMGRSLTRAEQRTRERIAAVGLTLLAHYGRAALSPGRIAQAMTIQTATFRRHFVDLDTLLAELIGTELRRLARLVGDVPRETPNRQAAQRAAWFAATRHLGALAPAWQLIVRDLPEMPDDLRPPLQQTLDELMFTIAGPLGPQCLAMLGHPVFSLADIEAMLAAIADGRARRAPAAPAEAAVRDALVDDMNPPDARPHPAHRPGQPAARLAARIDRAPPPVRAAPPPGPSALECTAAPAPPATARHAAGPSQRPRQLHAPP